MKAQRHVGVLGATSLVGQLLLPRLAAHKCEVTAFTRGLGENSVDGVIWRQLGVTTSTSPSDPRWGTGRIPLWICVAPIWVVQEYFPLLEAYGVRRIVALSSTSRFTKVNSSDLVEQETVDRLVKAEKALRVWAEGHNIEWVILRPTLIYGLGCDRNIAEMVRIIRRFGFFPLFGKADGLRQPIHAADVAEACVSALLRYGVINRAYNISGGEVVTYREMVTRVFFTLGQPLRLLPVPLWLFRVVVVLFRGLPRYRHWNAAMAARMNSDMVFEHSEATRDLAFKPRDFMLTAEDIPK